MSNFNCLFVQSDPTVHVQLYSSFIKVMRQSLKHLLSDGLSMMKCKQKMNWRKDCQSIVTP